MAGTGYRPGRPVKPEPKVMRMFRDGAVEIAARLVTQARLGDVGAAEIVLRWALAAPASPQEPPK
jgi:hypothetical protein